MLHALNPRDVNLGAAWEERRRAWLENAGANRYFWYSFVATIIVILSWFALAWIHNDRVRERWQLAEHAADALRYGEYCKRKAKEAIDRYNLHIETCNRVIEASESGMATPETANLEDYKRELQRLKSDNDAKELQVTRLSEQLEQKAAELNSLTERGSNDSGQDGGCQGEKGVVECVTRELLLSTDFRVFPCANNCNITLNH